MKEGKQIKLRDWQLDDLEEYLFWNTGKKKWMDFDAPYYPRLTSREIRFNIKTYKRKIEKNNWKIPRSRWVIADLHTNKLLGMVSWYWEDIETNWISIGITIYDDQNWGKGIGEEALKLWIDYLFDATKELIRLDLRTWSGNIRMVKLAKKLGFKEEARYRKARMVNGEYYDSIGMGILREEWEGN